MSAAGTILISSPDSGEAWTAASGRTTSRSTMGRITNTGIHHHPIDRGRTERLAASIIGFAVADRVYLERGAVFGGKERSLETI